MGHGAMERTSLKSSSVKHTTTEIETKRKTKINYPPEKMIAVGTAIAGRPPHRSVREELPHTAPPLSDDGRDESIATCRACTFARTAWSGTVSGAIAKRT